MYEALQTARQQAAKTKDRQAACAIFNLCNVLATALRLIEQNAPALLHERDMVN
jgi:hypothetical protein